MRLAVLVLACAALVVPVGCGGDDSGGDNASKPADKTKTTAGGAQAPEVTMKDIAFKPMELSVKKGTTVTWTNDDSVGHDVKSSGGPAKFTSGASGGMKQGDTFKQKFTKPGTYDYVCTVHSNMSGFVVVQ